jgi:hypothetical protein
MAACLVMLGLWAREGVTLRIDMTVDLSGPSTGKVSWSGEGDGFAPDRAAMFEVLPGTATYEVVLPDEPGRIGIEPVNMPARVVIDSMSVRRLGIPLRVWDADHGFEGWVAKRGVEDMDVRGGSLVMRATGSDTGLASVARLELAGAKRMVDAMAAALAGLCSALLALLWGRARKASAIVVQSLVIAALGACLGEVALRIYHHFVPVFIFPGERTRRFRGQPFGLDYDFRLNSQGFKDVETSVEKAAGTVRILALGDSSAFGVVPYEHNYLTLLEQDLRRASPPAEVVNMGIPATGPREYVQVLVDEGLPLHGDMVLVSFFVGNDFIDVQPSRPVRSYVLALLRYALLPRPAGRLVNGEGRYDDDAPNYGPEQYLAIEKERARIFRERDGVLDASFPDVQQHLARMKQICDARGLELLVVLIPDEVQVDPALQAQVVGAFAGHSSDFDFERPNRRMREDLERRGVRYLDLLAPFTAATRDRRLYRPRDSHWNIAGNRLAADLIRDALLRGDTRFWPRPGR